MMDLARVSLLLGAIVGLIHLPFLLAPLPARTFLAGFPRNRQLAWIIAAVDIVWAAWLLNDTPLGRFEVIKHYLPVLTPIAFFAVVFLVDELLAARALGGLMVLVPAPLLNIARWHPSPFRLVVVVFAYILAVEGIVLLLSPYWFRRAVQAVTSREYAFRAVGVAGILLGALLVILGLTVY